MDTPAQGLRLCAEFASDLVSRSGLLIVESIRTSSGKELVDPSGISRKCGSDTVIAAVGRRRGRVQHGAAGDAGVLR